MSKFKNFVFGVMLQEADWDDDPTEKYWDRSPVNVDQNLYKKDTLYTKPIQPVQPKDWVYIKCITQQENSLVDPAVSYLTGDKNKPFTRTKENGKKFSLEDATKFVEQHPRKTFKTTFDSRPYERHYEIEKI